MFVPNVTAVGGLLWLSAIVALLPVAVFFVLVGAVRMRSHWAGAIALGVGLLVAIAGFQMPVDMAVAAALLGAENGFDTHRDYRDCGRVAAPSDGGDRAGS